VGEIQERGANIVAFCPQRPEFLRQMRDKYDLGMDILRDEGNNYAAKFGLRFEVPDYLQEVYLKIPLDLPRLNGEPSWTLAMPARYVVDQSGRIVAADYAADYTNRPEPEKTLADLDRI
jgi:peroxiredoxin